MELNDTGVSANLTLTEQFFNSNITLLEVTKHFNINVSNLTHQSVETQIKLFNLYEAYRTKEKEQLLSYKFAAYIIGTLIILSNITVVISSGLILKKGQQPKSTYLLLGNVSLADTIVGISIVFGAIVDNSSNSNPLCIFQMGMLVCPAMVSIFSVGFIAVDRYIFILHGLYYQRWFTTTKVRIGILCIWMISITLAFLPATGYVNPDSKPRTNCNYIDLFPKSLVLFNSLLSIVPICIVAVLYFKILVSALRQVKNIKASEKTMKRSETAQSDLDQPKLRIFRGNPNARKLSYYNYSADGHTQATDKEMKRRASFTCSYDHSSAPQSIAVKSKSSSDLIDIPTIKVKDFETMNSDSRASGDSVLSVTTVTSYDSDKNISPNKNYAHSFQVSYKKRHNKPREPNKWRAIIVVMLTSGSFIVSWLPFFVTVIFYVTCEDKFENPRCRHMRFLMAGPLCTIAFLNSVLNPLVYAWWHRSFKKSLKKYYGNYFSIFIASLPGMGWTGNSFTDYRCWYVALFPSALLIILSVIVLSVIIMVVVLYAIILHSAVKAVDRIREHRKTNTKIAYINRTYTGDEGIQIREVSRAQITITVSTDTEDSSVQMRQINMANKIRRKISKVSTYYGQAKVMNSHPTKLKAVKTVMIVIMCFVGTWAPYYVTVIIYVDCNIMKNGYECVPLELLTLGPLYLLGVCNSLCDPLIYAWRHSGFKRTLRKMYWKYMLKHRI